MFKPLKVRNFCLLFGGQTISYLGDTFYVVALPWIILTNIGDVQTLSIVLTIYGIARVGTLLLGGMLSDLLHPRKIMLMTDFMRAGIVGLLGLLALWTRLTLWQFYLFTALLGVFQGLFGPASLAIMPDILPDDQLQAGNALNAASLQLAGLLGSTLAGILITVTQSGLALLIDAFSFIASVVTLAAIRKPRSDAQKLASVSRQDAVGLKEDEVSLARQTFLRFIYHSRMFQVVVVVVVMSNLCVGFMEVALPALAHNLLKTQANGYGFMLGAFGIGAIVGGLSTGILSKSAKRGVIGLLLLIIEAALISSIPFIGGLFGVMISLLGLGFMAGITNVLFFTIMQQKLPRPLLGRSMGTLTFASRLSYPFSVAAAGVVAVQFGLPAIFLLCGLLLLLTALIGLSQHQMRTL